MNNTVFRSLSSTIISRNSSLAKIIAGHSSTGSKWHQRIPAQLLTVNYFSTKKNEVAKDIVSYSDFHSIRDKSKDSFLEMINIYKGQEQLRRGHVEFIYSALNYMREFGVEKDLSIYKALIDIFPKGKMIPKNMIQAEFMHYPKHQQCAIDLLEQMELNKVIPDWNMEEQLLNVFGKRGHPLRRYWRMMYWMPKFKNLSPWPIPDSLTNDSYELAMCAITRIVSVDPASKVTVYKTSDVQDSLDDTWIVSGQSPDQHSFLSNLPKNTPIFVDGRYRIYIKEHGVTYFVLRADIKPTEPPDVNYDDVSDLYVPLFTKPKTAVIVQPTVHEQEDGTILAVCCTGTSSRDSLLSWIRSLEKSNPNLSNLSVVFTLKAPPDDFSLAKVEKNEKNDQISDKSSL